jgi:hypothetical protein
VKIVNETRFDTRALRRLAMAVARRGELDPAKVERVTVNVRYPPPRARRNGRYVTGRAILRGNWCVIRIPRPAAGEPEEANAPMVAFVLAHEFAHLRGVEHRDMGPRYRWSGYDERFAWAAEDRWRIAHRPEPQRVKPGPVERMERERTSIETRSKAWTTRLRRAQTALKKLERRRREIERKMAAIKAKGEGR